MRTKPELAEIEEKNGVILPACFPKILGEHKRGYRVPVFNAGSKLFNGLRLQLICSGIDARLCLGKYRQKEARRQQQYS